MELPPIVVRYHREFPVPVAKAFAWLTDFQDDDPQRTDRIVVSRPVKERHPDRVVLDGTVEMLGKRSRGTAEVRLFPPDRWEARIVDGAGRGSVYDYHLTPTRKGCRLDVAYRLRVRRPSRRIVVRLLKPWLWRQLDRMWDGFAASMAKDLAAAR